MKRALSTCLALILSAFLTGCTGAGAPNHQFYLSQKGLETQLPNRFQHCHGYGCKHVSTVEFTQKDWAEFERLFTPAPKTPKTERKRIARAIALFEDKVGVLTGTHEDIWGTFQKTGAYQQDCVDESTNTTIYLSLLEQQGLMKFHKLEAPTARVPLIHAGRWPHQTALISEIETSKFFVVDSWFHNNGAPAEIVPLKQWKEGWKPDEEGDS